MNQTSQNQVVRKVGQFQSLSSRMIGDGFSSNVFLGNDTLSGAVVVFKIIPNENVNTTVMEMLLRNELRALQQLNHPYILKTYAIDRNQRETVIVCQYCEGGDLMANIRQEGAIEEGEALDILTQIASGVNYIHSLGILHRDLKTSNILLKQDNSIRIGDFGFCEYVNERPPGHKFVNVGSPLYMPPEAYHRNQYSTRSDAWSLGVILYEMLIGTAPFMGLDYDSMVINVRSGALIRCLDVSDFCKSILFGLLQVDVKNRWDTNRLLAQLKNSSAPSSCCSDTRPQQYQHPQQRYNDPSCLLF